VIAIRETENIRITIRLICEVPRTSPIWYQISNIIFKRSVVELMLLRLFYLNTRVSCGQQMSA